MAKRQSKPALNIVGTQIRKARKKLRMQQVELSIELEFENVHICRGGISRIENGHRQITDIELEAFAKVLKISPNDLFHWEEKSKEL